MLSSTRHKLQCDEDLRRVAYNIGWFAIMVLLTALSVIVVPDAFRLARGKAI
jgi:hypothetical protein